MKKRITIIGLIFVLFIFIISFLIFKYGPNFNIYLIPPSAKQYAELALDRMNNGLYASGSEWEEIKKVSIEKLENVENYQDTHPILEDAIKIAGGEHLFIMYQNENSNNSDISLSSTYIEDDILILKLPSFISGDNNKLKEYANILNNALLNEEYRGIIIDLRDNTGGDMGPMLSGLSSLLPDGKLIEFEYRNGHLSDVILEDGSIIGGGSNIIVDNNHKITSVSIAILLNNLTASSGEIIALAFKGLDNVKTFGVNSYGLTSGNSQISLYDNTIMQLTTARIIDREGNVYENDSIEVDVESERPIEDAKNWIYNKLNNN